MVNEAEEFYERILEAINGSTNNGDFVTKWVLVMEVIDSDGDRGAWTVQSEQATTWDVLGLLRYAENKYNAYQDMHTIASLTEVEDEDDN